MWTAFINTFNVLIWKVTCCLYMPGHSWAVTLDTLGGLLLAIHSELTLKTLLLQQLVSLLLGGIQIPNFGHLLKCVFTPATWVMSVF